MGNGFKALLALAGIVIFGNIIADGLHFNSTAVSFGFVMGTVGSIAYTKIKQA